MLVRIPRKKLLSNRRKPVAYSIVFAFWFEEKLRHVTQLTKNLSLLLDNGGFVGVTNVFAPFLKISPVLTRDH